MGSGGRGRKYRTSILLLGQPITVELSEAKHRTAPGATKELQQIFESFPQIFDGTPGQTAVIEHVIHTGDNIKVRQKPYRIPCSQRELVRKEIDSMMEAGIIQPSVSAWASPIVLVSKKDGGVHFCVDYRRLNSKSTIDAYPMPLVEELFEKIGPTRVISTLDMVKGFWQIPLDRVSQEKTAFCTPFGLYEFKVMPFGLHSAPATFQRLMNQVLRDCQSFAGVYIDDIVVYSSSCTWGT